MFRAGPQHALVVLPAIDDANDYGLAFLQQEHDRCPTLEAYCAKAGADIIAPRAPSWKGLERRVRRLDSIDGGARNLVSGFSGDVVMEPEQVCFR